MKAYRKRVYDHILQEELEGVGAVIIEGAKWCGKTTTAEQAAKSVIYMDKAGKIEEIIALARLMPDKILAGEFPPLPKSATLSKRSIAIHFGLWYFALVFCNY
jgi:hypothetical protein